MGDPKEKLPYIAFLMCELNEAQAHSGKMITASS